jgi:AraC-like DNA-binding protein
MRRVSYYLLHWRMQIAGQELRNGTSNIGTIAARLGDGSDSAFSNAFKRVHCNSPKHYREMALGLCSPP